VSVLSERFSDAPTTDAGYLLAAVVAAAVAGSDEVRVESGSNEVLIDFGYYQYSSELAAAILAQKPTRLDKAETRLVTAIRAGLIAGAPRVDFESWNGASGVRYKVTNDSVKEEILSKAPWKDGKSQSRITVRFRTGLSRKIFNVGGKDDQPEVREMLVNRCRYAGHAVLYNGDKINEAFQLGEGLVEVTLSSEHQRPPVVTCQAEISKEEESSSSYYAKFLYGGEEVESRIVCLGLEYPVELPLADELGFCGIIVADHLVADRNLAELKEDTTFDDLLNDVENDLLGIAGNLVDVIDELQEDQVESVLETLDQVIETYRSSGENEEALELLKRLVEVENLPDEVRAAHLTQMARTFERNEQDETSFEYYGRALDYWGRIPDEEQDLELVATALLGAARLMGYYDSDPDTAMNYAKNALALRRSVGEEDDLEGAEAAVILAGLYSEHFEYPQSEYLEIEALLTIGQSAFEKHYGQTHNKVADVNTSLGKFCKETGQLVEAETCFLRALAIKEKLFGSRDESVGRLFDHLGALFEASGDIIKSGQYYTRAMEVREHNLEKGHPEIVQRMNDLVVLYRVYGYFDKAEPLFLRLLGVDTKVQESTKDVDASDLSSLGLFYQVQDKFKKAEPFFLQALEKVEEQYGDEIHPDKAWVHGLLGKFYDEQYLFKKAESHLLQALKMTEEVLGDEHPDLIVHLDALTRHYRLQQLYTEAMPWAERALAVAEGFYGTQHPYLATALNSFGELLSHSGQAEMAGPVYLAAYEVQQVSEKSIFRVRSVPKRDLARLTIVRDQAEKLHHEAALAAKEYSSFAEAESLYLRALFLREQNLGAEHPDNARTLGLLADLYRNHRRYEGAETLYKRSLDLRKKALGEGHPDCCLSLNELTQVLLLQKEFERAKPLLEEWLVIVERTLGKQHAERAEVLVRAGQVCEALGKASKARALLQQAVTIRHNVFGTEHPTFAVTLAELMRVEDKPEQSADLYDFVVGCLEKNLVDDDPLLIPIFENYAKVLNAINNTEKAVTFETQAMVLRVKHGLDFGTSD
jgi:tetratricopeptide repeat protein